MADTPAVAAAPPAQPTPVTTAPVAAAPQTPPLNWDTPISFDADGKPVTAPAGELAEAWKFRDKIAGAIGRQPTAEDIANIAMYHKAGQNDPAALRALMDKTLPPVTPPAPTDPRDVAMAQLKAELDTIKAALSGSVTPIITQIQDQQQIVGLTQHLKTEAVAKAAPLLARHTKGGQLVHQRFKYLMQAQEAAAPGTTRNPQVVLQAVNQSVSDVENFLRETAVDMGMSLPQGGAPPKINGVNDQRTNPITMNGPRFQLGPDGLLHDTYSAPVPAVPSTLPATPVAPPMGVSPGIAADGARRPRTEAEFRADLSARAQTLRGAI